MYDVIIVGGRVAGAATAMLLARRGLEVLVVDRAGFPSATLSTHQVQLPKVARLRRWGLLDRVVPSGAPATRRVRFDPAPVVLEGRFPAFEGSTRCTARGGRSWTRSWSTPPARPERRCASASSLTSWSPRTAGCRDPRGGEGRGQSHRAGPAGRRGRRQALAGRQSRRRPRLPRAAGALGGLLHLLGGRAGRGGVIFGRGQRLGGMWPTNDRLVPTYVAWPVTELESLRTDVEGNLLGTLDLAGDLGQRGPGRPPRRALAGTRVHRTGSANSARCSALTELLEAPAA